MSATTILDNVETSVRDITIKALQNNAHIAQYGMEPYTLRDTGATVQSSFIEDTNTGFRINYETEYAKYIFHNPRIKNVTTPGTSPYWDDLFTMSEAYEFFLSRVDADIEEMLRNAR